MMKPVYVVPTVVHITNRVGAFIRCLVASLLFLSILVRSIAKCLNKQFGRKLRKTSLTNIKKCCFCSHPKEQLETYQQIVSKQFGKETRNLRKTSLPNIQTYCFRSHDAEAEDGQPHFVHQLSR